MFDSVMNSIILYTICLSEVTHRVQCCYLVPVLHVQLHVLQLLQVQ
jgi:hypothetical protein